MTDNCPAVRAGLLSFDQQEMTMTTPKHSERYYELLVELEAAREAGDADLVHDIEIALEEEDEIERTEHEAASARLSDYE
jgi:hypothetical protein